MAQQQEVIVGVEAAVPRPSTSHAAPLVVSHDAVQRHRPASVPASALHTTTQWVEAAQPQQLVQHQPAQLQSQQHIHSVGLEPHYRIVKAEPVPQQRPEETTYIWH